MSKLILPRRFAAGPAPIDPFQSVADPLHLTSRVTTIQLQSGGSVNAIALRNPHHLAMEINEIKFRVKLADGDTAQNGPPPDFQKINGQSILVGLTLVDETGSKRTKMTGTQVPAWCFGPGKWRGYVDLEYQEDDDFAVAEYSWPLAQPFYVPEGYGIEPVLSATGLITSAVTSFTFQMTVCGRSLMPEAPKPSESRVPFATAYVSKPFDAFGAPGTDESTETDLMNTTGVTLHVDRFVGRCNLFQNSGTEGRDDDFEYSQSAVTMRMMNSRGDAIIDRFTPFRSIFVTDERSLPMYHDMLPGDYYRVFLISDFASSDHTNNGVVSVALTGWRPVPLRSL